MNLDRCDSMIGRIKIGSPRRIAHGDILDVAGLRVIFVKPGRECEVKGNEVTIEIRRPAERIAARLAKILRHFGMDARRRGRVVILKPPAQYVGSVRLPIIRQPQAYYVAEALPGPVKPAKLEHFKDRTTWREEKT